MWNDDVVVVIVTKTSVAQFVNLTRNPESMISEARRHARMMHAVHHTVSRLAVSGNQLSASYCKIWRKDSSSTILCVWLRMSSMRLWDAKVRWCKIGGCCTTRDILWPV